MTFSDNELHEIGNIIEATLKQNSVETKLSTLEGLRSRLNLTQRKTIQIHYKGKRIYPKETPSFFYQDYMLISEEILKLYSVQEVFTAPLLFDDTIKEITENKRSYLLAVVIENEITRLKRQKKGKWKGKEHVSAEEQRITIDKDKEQKILSLLCQDKYNVGVDMASHELIRLVAAHDLSSFYKPGQTKKICSLLRELTKILGNEWGELAAFKTTNGEKTLKQIKNNYHRINKDNLKN
ncbi:MAG: hypothetical protein K5860_10270 [Bacteroidales bacterium]|nr:hypothetical protein [Bacteroidales bacterium]